MRTLTAHEAIEVAEQLDILLFDRYYNSEVTVEQAKLFIQKQRDPVSFVLEDWPETDKEAEQFVLGRFHTSLVARKMMEASISDLWEADEEGRTIHPYAADLAAKRLVEQKELEVVQADQDEWVYRIPRNIHFTDSFLDSLRCLVCDECAHLNPEKPFHKTCLLALLDYLINGDFSLSDVTVALETNDPGARWSKILKPSISTRWLSQTVSATKWRWNSVVKPMLMRESQDDSATVPEAPPNVEPSLHDVPGPDRELDQSSWSGESIRTRDKISKQELIRYLQSVEILDEGGELAQLRAERDRLLKQMEAKEREMQQMERQRAFLQGQCEDMQQDMDTLLQAMQIAKRRGQTSAPVIDVEVGSEQQAQS